MKKNTLKALMALLIVFTACGRNEDFNFQSFSNIIHSFTYGAISKNSDIVIQLQYPIQDSSIINDEMIKLTPPVKGKVSLKDPQTIVFKPEKSLQQNKKYKVAVNLKEIYDVPDSLAQFQFDIKTFEQKARVLIDGFYPETNQMGKVTGKVVTRDDAQFDAVKSSFSIAGYPDATIEWMPTKSTKVFPFKIKNVAKFKTSSELKINIDGSAIEAETNEEKEIEIPAIGLFEINNMRVVSAPDQFILLQCTEKLNENQDLEGIITLGDHLDFDYDIVDNEIKIFPKTLLNGEISINVSNLLENDQLDQLSKNYISKAKFNASKPAFDFVKQGNILTSNHNFAVLISAQNLKGITVTVNKIPQKNVLQFFQNNDYDGRYRMEQVAYQVAQQHFDLSAIAQKSLSQKQNFLLDLKNHFQQEPGAIYEVVLKASYTDAILPCAAQLNDQDETDKEYENYRYFLEPEKWSERAYGYDYYDDYWYDGYWYDDEDDPCKKRFYNNLEAKNNFLVSDIGTTVKIGADHQAHVYCSDMNSTLPLSDVQITFYNYSGKEIGQCKTNQEGIGQYLLSEKAFFAEAKKGNQFIYLKLNDAQAISTSKFDVEGSKVEEGIKAFIYSERGVRRPGDTIFLGFMLEDAQQKIPDNFPIKIQLRDARGRLYYKAINKQEAHGLYTFSIPTDPNDPTGNWWAKIEVAHLQFSKYLKVENVRPNRLKVIVNTAKVWSQDPTSQIIDFESRWLHGAKASNLKVSIVGNITKAGNPFDKYSKYSFQDPLNSYRSNKINLASVYLDENGKQRIQPSIKINQNAPGMLQIFLESKVFENSGGFSIGYDKVLYAPYKSFVGVQLPENDKYTNMLLTNFNNVFKLVNIDANQQKVDGTLKVSYYKIERRWWYDSFSDDLSSFISSGKVKKVKSEELKTNKGFASSTFNVKDKDWGKYIIVVENSDGHRTGSFFWVDWPYWSRGNRSGDNKDLMYMNFRTDKKSYIIGEPIEVSFPSGEGNRALITLENGSGIMHQQWVLTQAGETKVFIPTTTCKAPNAYVSISYIQKHANTDNDLPMRMFGISNVEIEDPTSLLNPIIQCNDEFKPNQNYNISISEKEGKEMAYTLAIVDEGLLDLTRFETPNPHTHFYQKEALGVKTWDIYSDVIGAYGNGVFPRLTVGGDAALKANKSANKSRFKPMVRFLGPFKLKANGKNQHQIAIPNYVGAVKVMVVAGKDLAYGNAEKVVAVRKDLMVQGNLPRVLSPEEEIMMPINLFVNNDKIKKVNLEVTSSSNIKASPSSYSTEMDGKTQKTILWKINCLEASGPAWIKIVAKANGEVSEYKVNINIRTPLAAQSDHQSLMLSAGASHSFNTLKKGFLGNNKLQVEISSSYPINLGQRLDYLIKYPYGCLEQTTSSVFPQLAMIDLLDLQPKQNEEMDHNIKSGIQRLQQFASGDGGFSYWIGGTYQSEWAELYAGHFLIVADKKGYDVPSELMKNWTNKQKRIARRPQYNDYYTRYNTYLNQAYRLYLLALKGNHNLSAMNKLREKELNATEKALLAASYAIIGKIDIAKKMLYNVGGVKEYRSWGYTFGSSDRDRALLLMCASDINDYRKADSYAKKISERLNSKSWMSTQSTAFSLIAMQHFNEHFKLGGEVNVEVNGKKYQSSKGMLSIEYDETQWKDVITVKNLTKNQVHVHFNHNYAPNYNEVQASEFEGKKIEIDVVYYNLENKEIDLKEVTHGQEFYAKVKITSLVYDQTLENLMLDFRVAGAFEINNDRLYSNSSSNIYHYKDVLDDRILYAFDLKARYAKTFKVYLTAGYKGKFYYPGAKIEAMYDYEVIDKTQGYWLDIQ